jgi:hypothetical protein
MTPVTERPPASSPHPSRRSLRRLDWFVFLVADVQTGFGPFVAVYLTSQKWTQVEIGLVLTIAGLVSLLGQIPGGALVDTVRSERVVAAVAVTMIATSAMIYATWPIFPAVLTAATLQAAASCILGPAIAAISLGLVGHAAIGERFGRNARFASIGAGLSAAVMGGFGYFFSPQAVFFVTAALLLPTLVVLRGIAAGEIDPERAHGNQPELRTNRPRADQEPDRRQREQRHAGEAHEGDGAAERVAHVAREGRADGGAHAHHGADHALGQVEAAGAARQVGDRERDHHGQHGSRQPVEELHRDHQRRIVHRRQQKTA